VWVQGTAGPAMVREKGTSVVLLSLSFGKSVFSGVQVEGFLEVKRKHKEIEQREDHQGRGKS